MVAMTDEFTPLAESLERYFKNLGAPPISVVTRLSSEWESIVGPALSSVTSPVSIVDGVLTVVAEEPAWSSQVSWMEAQIKERFSDLFAPHTLEKVKVVLGK